MILTFVVADGCGESPHIISDHQRTEIVANTEAPAVELIAVQLYCRNGKGD